MKLTLAALLALAFAASATPASACFLFCYNHALADDSYPPGEPALSPTLQMLERARDNRGLSLEAFYNDPALALMRPERPVVRARY